jgi:hypothetical protein
MCYEYMGVDHEFIINHKQIYLNPLIIETKEEDINKIIFNPYALLYKSRFDFVNAFNGGGKFWELITLKNFNVKLPLDIPEIFKYFEENKEKYVQTKPELSLPLALAPTALRSLQPRNGLFIDVSVIMNKRIEYTEIKEYAINEFYLTGEKIAEIEEIIREDGDNEGTRDQIQDLIHQNIAQTSLEDHERELIDAETSTDDVDESLECDNTNYEQSIDYLLEQLNDE